MQGGNSINKAKIAISVGGKKNFEPIVEASEKAEEAKPKVINVEEVKKQLLNSEDLISFVSKNSKYVERALSERSCIDLFESHLFEDKIPEKK